MPKRKCTNQVAVLHLIRTVEQRSGSVSWTLRYRDPENRPMKMSLGEWPVVTLKQAQDIAGDDAGGGFGHAGALAGLA